MQTVMLSHKLCQEGMDYLLSKGNIRIVCHDTENVEQVWEDFRLADAYILRIGQINRKMIEGAENLKVIARPGVGVDTIDVDAATEYGIPVVITPGANSRSVAEHALAMLFALSKNLTESNEEAKKGNYMIRNKGASIELEGKLLGVAGFGRIGKEVAKMAEAIGLHVMVFDPFISEEEIKEAGYQPADRLEELFTASDFVTLHMPSTPETRGIVNKKMLSSMKAGAFLINCARGDLVDEKDLYDALTEGRLAGAAEDMMVSEPFDINSPLLKLNNFVVSPHMAALSRESSMRAAQMAVDGVISVLNGEKWPYVCNPEAYQHERWKDR